MQTHSPHTICLAVLPFDNLSANDEQAYFCRGLVEDLITDLTRFPSLEVIASHSAQTLVGEAEMKQQLVHKLGIDYVLKGSFRYRQEQVRINTQLIDSHKGRIEWAERYDAPADSIFEIQDDIIERVVGALSTRIVSSRLSAARKKPMTQLEAYDCWLRGFERLRRGTIEDDAEARKYFLRALEIDPHYARAYAGLSLSYFNEWSCNAWEHWVENEKGAYDHAVKANELDETDHVVQVVLGRIFLYRRQFALARKHLDKALSLNPNDADNLVQIALSKAFLGDTDQAEDLFQKSLKLNPYRDSWYYAYGAVTAFAQRRYEDTLKLGALTPLSIMVDFPGYLGASYAYLGDMEKAAHYIQLFLSAFQEKITFGRKPEPGEALQWVRHVNPFENPADADHLIEGLKLAGVEDGRETVIPPSLASVQPTSPASDFVFRKENNMRLIAFEGQTVHLPEVKGYQDLARLLAHPGEEIHCSELMGTPVVVGTQEIVIDEKARQAYKVRIRNLQEELEEAEQMNDFGKVSVLNQELDQLLDHLSKAMGLGGKTRKLDSSAEKARSAVTWRIRSAIKKIKAAHPPLAKHLSNSIQTGTFCSYSPEKEVSWEV